MIILAIVVEHLQLSKNINESIKCDQGYAYSSGKQISHGLRSKVGQWWETVSLTQRK